MKIKITTLLLLSALSLSAAFTTSELKDIQNETNAEFQSMGMQAKAMSCRVYNASSTVLCFEYVGKLIDIQEPPKVIKTLETSMRDSIGYQFRRDLRRLGYKYVMVKAAGRVAYIVL